MLLVGLCAKAGEGKNYCAKVLRAELEAHGLRVGEWSFAAPIKAHVYASHTDFPSLHEVFEDKPDHIRTLLQEHGTDYGRAVFGDDYWVRTAEGMLYALEQYAARDVVIFPDVRFNSEAFFIRSGGRSLTTCVAKFFREALEKSGISEDDMDKLLETDLETYNDIDALCNTEVTQRVLELFDGPSILLQVVSDRDAGLTPDQREHVSEHLDLDESLLSGVIYNYSDETEAGIRDQLGTHVEGILQHFTSAS